MKIRELVNRTEVTVAPFASIDSIEAELIQNAYLVIEEDGRFIGLLTPSDVLARGHNLVIDCYTEKPPINENEEAEAVMGAMLRGGPSVAPVLSDEGRYLGSVQIKSMLQQIWDITKLNVSVEWVNVIGDVEMERNKRDFAAELFHNTKNPLQVIISAVDMLRASSNGLESKILLGSIESSARLLDELVTKLHASHFKEAREA
jgi:CBS domain-containing protein